MDGTVVTAIGTPNIALVKYWGKRNSEINLPMNSSLSMTLNETLNTTTSVLFSDDLKEDRMYINDELQNIRDSANEKSVFAARALDHLRMLAGAKSHALIVSRNSFPSSAGLASSASGAVTLVYAASNALGLKLPADELSIITRQISGSACRSAFGGFVAWHKGNADDGSDSCAECIAGKDYWPDVIDIITLVSSAKKKISSSEGHAITVKTSTLYKTRPPVAEERVNRMITAIKERDFETLAIETIKDSNNMHATMLDSYPPIIYMNDTSKEIMMAIHELNNDAGRMIAAYTFDAGANAHIITRINDKEQVMEKLGSIVGNFIVAGQGDGPRLLGDNASLISNEILSR
jgi:diphosphomevalonate decarboxylase